jgi:Protein of unknown function (DUF3096)
MAWEVGDLSRREIKPDRDVGLFTSPQKGWWALLQALGRHCHGTIAQITPLVALLAGILILIVPRLLSFIVAIYLIIVGLIGLNAIHIIR